MGKPFCGLYGLNTVFSWSKSSVDGRISFGGVAEDNVRHAVLLENNYDPRHYITMDASGNRKGRTTMEAPCGFHFKAGQDCDLEKGAVNMQVENGNLVIDVQNGDLDIKCRNMNIRCEDKDDDKGNFTLVTNNKIRMEAGETVELFSPKKVEVVCNNVLKLMGDKEVDFIAGICNMISYDDRRGAPSECKGFGNDDQSVGGIS